MRGGKRDNSGRPKGSKNKKTAEWQSLGELIVEGHAQRFSQCLDKADNETFMRMYIQVLNYFKPKLRSIENTTQDDIEPLIIIMPDDKKGSISNS